MFIYGLVTPIAGNTGTDCLLLLGAVATLVLLVNLREVRVENCWIWVILAVFFAGYLGRTYWIASMLPNWRAIDTLYPDISFVSIDTLRAGIPWIIGSYLVFVSVAIGYLRIPMKTVPGSQTRYRDALSRLSIAKVRNAEIVAALLIGALLYAQMQLHIGILGTTTRHLPLQLDTFINRGPSALVGILTLCVWLELENQYGRPSFPILLLASAGIAESFISTSRGSIVIYVFPSVLLIAIYKRPSHHKSPHSVRTNWGPTRALALAALTLSGTFLLYPIVSSLRISMLGDATSVASPDSTYQTLGVSPTEGEIAAIVFRIQGADGVWTVLSNPRAPSIGRVTEALTAGGNAATYTRNVVGVTTPGDFRAPGLIGGLMLLGGYPLVLATSAIYCICWGWIWRRMCRLAAARAVVPLVAGALMVFTSEGTFVLRDLVVTAAGVAVIEALLRVWRRRNGETSSSAVLI